MRASPAGDRVLLDEEIVVSIFDRLASLRPCGRARWPVRCALAFVATGSFSVLGLPAGATPAGADAQTYCGPVLQPCTWNFGQADVYNAQAAGREGAGVLVAVVDTWVDLHHPAFGGRVIDEADCVGANGNAGACQDHTYAPDACVHGTHVAGTIASSNFGVAPKASILAVQVLTQNDSQCSEASGSPADVAAGIEFAVAHGAKVINLSLGDLVPLVSQDSSTTAAVHQAAAAGVLVVFAAGNNTVPVTDNYGTDALLVAATGPGGGLAVYSQRSGSVNLAAPGGDDGAAGLNGCTEATCILSTLPGNSYGLLEGTSMAAPHVSGTAALLLAQNPSRGRPDVIHAMEATAHPLAGAGSGLIDSAAALALEPQPGNTSSGSPSANTGSSTPPAQTGHRSGLTSQGGIGSPPGGSSSGGNGSTLGGPPDSASATAPGSPQPALPGGAPGDLASPNRALAGSNLPGHHGGGVDGAGVLAAVLLFLAACGAGYLFVRRPRPGLSRR